MEQPDPQEQLPLPGPGATDPPPEPVVAAAPDKPAEPTVSELQEQIAAAQSRESDLNQRLDQERARFDTFLERAPAQPQAQAPARIDPGGAPDPAIDIDGFNRHQTALAAQQRSDTEALVSEQTAEIRNQQTADNLWLQFSQRYPEAAGRRELATIAFQRLTTGGLPSDTSGLIDSVKAEIDRMIGSAPTASPQPNRTAVSGGSQPPSAPAPAPASDPIVSLGDSITDWQLKQGYI